MLIRFSGGMVRYGLPGAVMGVILSWAAGMHGPVAEAQTSRGVDGQTRVMDAGRGLPQAAGKVVANGEGNGTIAMVTSPPGTSQCLFLIDTRNHAFAIYRFDPTNSKGGALKLEAARQYQWDLKLEHYNNLAPEPAAIESMVKTLDQSPR